MLVFDKERIKRYESWFSTPEGVYVDEKEKELLLENMRFKRGGKVLEIGAGTGRYIEYLTDLGLDVTGVEPMDELIKIALQKTKIREGQIIKSGFENLPFEDESFDNVISITAFQFVSDKEKVIKEALRVAVKKVGIGFFNKYSVTNFFNTKERSRMYKGAKFLSGAEMRGIVKKVLGGKEERLKLRYTLYLPLNIAYFVPFVDDILEKINLPFGNFAMVVINKE